MRVELLDTNGESLHPVRRFGTVNDDELASGVGEYVSVLEEKHPVYGFVNWLKTYLRKADDLNTPDEGKRIRVELLTTNGKAFYSRRFGTISEYAFQGAPDSYVWVEEETNAFNDIPGAGKDWQLQYLRKADETEAPSERPAAHVTTGLIKIGGVLHTLTKVPLANAVDHDGGDTPLWGQICYREHSVRFSESSPEQELRSVLHEVIHAITYSYGIRELGADGIHQELAIQQLALGLAEVLESVGVGIHNFIGDSK